MPPSLSLPGWRLGPLLLVWSVPVLLGMPFAVMSLTGAQPTVTLWRVCVVVLVSWQVWAFISVAVVALTDRVVPSRPLRWRVVAVHACAALLACATQAAATAVAVRATSIAPGVRIVDIFLYWCMLYTPAGVIVYSAVVAVRSSQHERASALAHEAASRDLSQRLTAAQLHTLRAQLQPHFLFNTLNAVIALVRGGDTALATTALLDLSALLRASLRGDARVLIPLGDDLAFVRQYLAIEQLRLGDRLRVHIDVPDELQAIPVPSLCLQPLVENAIRHGLWSTDGEATLEVTGRATDGTLVLEVRDNGVGLPPSFDLEHAAGIGLRSARARLQQLFGSQSGVRLMANEAGRGAVTQVTLPIATAA